MKHLILLLGLAFPAQAFPPQAFTAHIIAGDLKGGYQVVVADVNGDGEPDLIAVASGQSDLVWYEGPSWTRHVMASGLHGMINVAAQDIDGDGIPEVAIAYEFSNEASKSAGIVAVLHHDGDPRRPWTLREIDRLPTSHRLRWGKLDGADVLWNAPLTDAASAPPDYRGHVPLVFYRPGAWKRETIASDIAQENEGVQHGFLIQGDGDLLTASFSGIDHYVRHAGRWTRTEISRGDPSPCPKCGASDLATGQLDGRKFIAAIEPWHGNQVAVYLERGGHWERSVIDDGLSDGHTLLTTDINGQGRDVIIAGYRGSSGGVRMYSWTASGWTKTDIKTGSQAASCTLLTKALKKNLICIGGAQLTLYNLTEDKTNAPSVPHPALR